MNPSEKEATVYKILSQLKITYSTLEHDVITTMEQGREISQKLEGVIPIKLLLLDKKTGKLYLYVKLNDGKKISFKDLGNALGTKNLSMAPGNLLQTKLGVGIGCATIFALLNDPDKEINIIIDKNIPPDQKINFHPMRNDATTTIHYSDMIKYLDFFGHHVEFL